MPPKKKVDLVVVEPETPEAMAVLPPEQLIKAEGHRLIVVLNDPTHFGKSLAAKAKLANVSFGLAYKLLSEPWFCAKLDEVLIATIRAEMPAIVVAAIQGARWVGRPGYQDRQLLLEILGMCASGASAGDGNARGDVMVTLEYKRGDTSVAEVVGGERHIPISDDDDALSEQICEVLKAGPTAVQRDAKAVMEREARKREEKEAAEAGVEA